jgi:hypothetical protein
MTAMRIASSVLAMTITTGELCAQAPAQGERDRAMSYLHATRKQFLDVVTQLSAAQWKYKPASGGWSVAEVAEHLTVTEGSVMAGIEQMLKAPATPDKKAETAGKDDVIMKGVPDRSRKVQAPEAMTPTGRFPTRDALVAEFKLRRDKTIEFIEKTPADLRAHMFPHPALKLIDCYQWILFLAAHSDRHIQQMKEVMADPGFPKQ